HGPQDAHRGSHPTTTHSVGRPPSEADVMSAGDFAGEVGSIAGRWIKKTLRRPPFLFFSLVQPVVWFVLFTAAFASIANINGFKESTGTSSYLVFLFAIALGFGIAWSGISTFIALTTRNSESTLMISLLTTFPLLFLSTAVMPKPLLQDNVRAIAVYNPITYIADGLHGLIITP